MSAKGKSKGIPANVVSMLAAADERNGFPPGTMQAVMAQEVGGNFDQYLADPTKYHYAPNAEGKRVARHTGKVSTAFGPFGILESTGRDPGYGVKPLQDKSLDEQVRFAADYLAARSKSGGGLQAGLAGYGEGTKYASQVVGRLPGGGMQASSQPMPVGRQPAPLEPPVMVAEAPAEAPFALPPELLAALNQGTAQAGGSPEADAWQAFLQGMPQGRGPVQVADLNYGGVTPAVVPQIRAEQVASRVPDFSAFSSWTGRA